MIEMANNSSQWLMFHLNCHYILSPLFTLQQVFTFRVVYVLCSVEVCLLLLTRRLPKLPICMIFFQFSFRKTISSLRVDYLDKIYSCTIIPLTIFSNDLKKETNIGVTWKSNICIKE